MNQNTPGLKKVFARIGPLAFFCILAAAVTWPLALHLGDRIPGWCIGDNFEYLWKMWWFKHSLIDLHANPLFAPSILYPQGFSLAYAEITPLHTVLGLPFTLLIGEIATYNLFALLSFILGGWAAYLLVFSWTGKHSAAILAGTLFVLNPYHVVRYGGILPLMAIEGLPVCLLGVEKWVTTRRWRWILLAGIGYLLGAWASIYYAFALLLLGPLYLLIRLKTDEPRVFDRRAVAQLAALVLAVLVITVPLAIPYRTLQSSSELVIPLQDTDYWSASVTDFLLPSGIHPLWGDWVVENALGVPSDYPQIAREFILGGGFVALLFAAYSLKKSAGKEKKAILAVTIAALILSFGPTLHLGRHPVVLPAPQAIVEQYNLALERIGSWLPAHESFSPLATDGVTIPLPALFLRWLIPPLTGMRAWNRFAVVISLGISLLAGLGFASWIRKELEPGNVRWKIHLAVLAFLGIAIFELWPISFPLWDVGPRPVDRWLAAQPDQGSIMILPVTSALSAPELWYSRYHGKPISFAYGTYLPYWYRQQYPELLHCPEAACLERLRSWGVAFVLLNLDDPSQGPLEELLDQSAGFERVIQIDNFCIYRLRYP